MTDTKVYRTWAEVSARAGRNDLPFLLVRNFYDIHPSDHIEAITSAWMMAEWPEQIAPPELWTMLFRQIPFTVDGELAQRAEHLAEKVTLYRGAVPQHRKGMSWTTDLAVAEWFAQRLNGLTEERGAVYEITVRRNDVLALNNGRGEHEAVVAWAKVDPSSFILRETA